MSFVTSRGFSSPRHHVVFEACDVIDQSSSHRAGCSDAFRIFIEPMASTPVLFVAVRKSPKLVANLGFREISTKFQKLKSKNEKKKMEFSIVGPHSVLSVILSLVDRHDR